MNGKGRLIQYDGKILNKEDTYRERGFFERKPQVGVLLEYYGDFKDDNFDGQGELLREDNLWY